MNQNKTAIVTGGTKKDVAAMACLVMNIKDTNPNLADEIVIFHDGISEKDQVLINNIFPTRFIFYKSPFEEIKDFGSIIKNRFSLMVFCKYECFKLLDEYDCVIWTDYDVVILKDLTKFKDTVMNGIKMTIHPNSPVINCFKISETKTPFLNSGIVNYNLLIERICLPIFCLTKDLTNYMELYNWCITKTVENAMFLYYPEEGIVNIMIQEFKLNIKKTRDIGYFAHPTLDKVNEETKILHSYGYKKFWSGIKNKTWENNYKKWVKLSGTRQPEKKLIHIIQKTIKTFLKNILPYGIVETYKNK